MTWELWVLSGIGLVLVLMTIYDLTQNKHAILRNFPIIGHFRYWLEAVGPELRQYIVTDNNEERPFSRDQRRWVYASSKRENNYFGFGTDNELELSPNYVIIRQATFPLNEPVEGDADFDPLHRLPCAKIVGGPRGRRKAFRQQSVVNVSAMSFGSLSPRAVEAINRGCAIAHCLHNTGEGGISPYHDHGGDLIWQVGTGYFGCREHDGTFSMSLLKENCDRYPVKMIEIKLSQGAKPGKGGVLPAAKVTAEIAKIRNVPIGKTVISPACHSAFHSVDEMLDFVERIADETGLPVGIKSAVGEMQFWHDLVKLMGSGTRGVDYIQIDGGEGGTGAAPLVFADHVSLPFKVAFSSVYPLFAEAGLHEKVVFTGSGKLGFPECATLAFALGCDTISVAREAMMSVGCIQAQKCHTGHCPTGVATQSQWLMRGLDPTVKSARLANYVVTLRKEVHALSLACGVAHPALVTLDMIDIVDDRFGSCSALDLFRYKPGWGRPSEEDMALVGRGRTTRLVRT
ncbi:MAG: FMN-binding glutamate synthase family protein [Planctomycetota bacterium]